MSWWVALEDDLGVPVVVVEHAEGGTYAAGGSSEADLNITYNYGALFRQAWDGVGLREVLDGKRAEETIPALEVAVEHLGNDPSGDYWEATPGNAGSALALLLGWAQTYPNARWRVN